LGTPRDGRGEKHTPKIRDCKKSGPGYIEIGEPKRLIRERENGDILKGRKKRKKLWGSKKGKEEKKTYNCNGKSQEVRKAPGPLPTRPRHPTQEGKPMGS